MSDKKIDEIRYGVWIKKIDAKHFKFHSHNMAINIHRGNVRKNFKIIQRRKVGDIVRTCINPIDKYIYICIYDIW